MVQDCRQTGGCYCCPSWAGQTSCGGREQGSASPRATETLHCTTHTVHAAAARHFNTNNVCRSVKQQHLTTAIFAQQLVHQSVTQSINQSINWNTSFFIAPLQQNFQSYLLQVPPPHTTTVLWPFFRDHPGEPVPKENFWTLWCKGRLTRDYPAGRHSIRTNQCPLPPSPHITYYE